nr:integrase, catalytic region, zinc finger, CCHC-type, peptidase aspartic, catalytic [Tanacetum cinerariifolium]
MSETSVANDTSGLVPQRQKASDYDNSDPVPQLQNVSSSADAHAPSQQELDLLFAPSTPTYVHAEENNDNQAEEEHLQDDEFTNPFCALLQEVAESSSHNIGQARQIKCYNCNDIGHLARNYTQPKRPQNSEYFKDKMLLMQAQKNGVALDEERLLFITCGQDNVVDEDVDEQPAPTAQNTFMVNLSFADPVYDEVGPSYDSNILSEDNAVPIVQSNVSSVPNDAYTMILNDMHEQPAQHVFVTTQNNVVDKSLTAELAVYKEQVELEVHLDYLKHLKESVETLHEIVEEAKVEKPLDRSLASAYLYTKHSQELLEYIVLWYLALGCSKHMTGDHSRLRNFVKKFIGTVRFGNDHFGAIMGYGDYVIGDSVISKIYYVEGLGHNLFSLGKFYDSDMEVAFRNHSFYA